MPIGWARFVGVTANLYSDRFVDGTIDPILPQMINLADALSTMWSILTAKPRPLTGIFGIIANSNRAENSRIENAQKDLVDSDVSIHATAFIVP